GAGARREVAPGAHRPARGAARERRRDRRHPVRRRRRRARQAGAPRRRRGRPRRGDGPDRRRSGRRRAHPGGGRRRAHRGREMIAWLERRRALVWLAAIGLAGSGALVAARMPSGVYPEVEFPRIVVVGRSGDAPPDLTQVSLTRPLEVVLATVLGVERI